jgi:hypothetical protein
VIGRAAVERDLVIVACAISAGVHAALTPGHYAEGAAAGAGFGASTFLLALLAFALTRTASAVALAGASALLAGLIASYALAITTGIPLLYPHPEPIEGLALVTKAVELAGLGAALHLLSSQRAAGLITFPPPKGTLA